jgi:hypothetical protein
MRVVQAVLAESFSPRKRKGQRGAKADVPRGTLIAIQFSFTDGLFHVKHLASIADVC